MPHIYILECADGKLYVGSTPDLERRLAEHNAGERSAYTVKRRPVRLVFAEEAATLDDAFRLERQIKGWRREKKLALIRGDFDALPRLADTRRPTD